MTSSDAYLRARAANSVGDPAGVALIQALGDADPLVRRTAAGALGEMRLKNAVEPLLKLLKDEEPSVRKASAIALGRIGDVGAASAVQSAAAEAGADQWEYFAALYRLGNHDYLDRVTAALRSEFADTRQNALKSLLEFGDNRAVPALLSYAGSDMSKPQGLATRFALAKGFGVRG